MNKTMNIYQKEIQMLKCQKLSASYCAILLLHNTDITKELILRHQTHISEKELHETIKRQQQTSHMQNPLLILHKVQYLTRDDKIRLLLEKYKLQLKNKTIEDQQIWLRRMIRKSDTSFWFHLLYETDPHYVRSLSSLSSV